MILSPETVKETLLGKVNEMAASSWQYVNHPSDFTRNRKISFSDSILSTISMQKSQRKVELLKYFDFSTSAPTASALIQQRKKISPEAFSSLFYSSYGKICSWLLLWYQITVVYRKFFPFSSILFFFNILSYMEFFWN